MRSLPLLVVAPKLRQAGRLDWEERPEAPTLEALRRAPEPGWLGGGEPTLRPDLPALIEVSAREGWGWGLESDGLALASAGVVERLQGAGLRRVRLQLHSLRSDAHDWLVGLVGAGQRVRKAVALCAQRGLRVELIATVTRPTADHLPELTAWAGQQGVSALWLRRWAARGPARSQAIALAPRLGLVAGRLEEAVEQGELRRLPVGLLGWPTCAARGPHQPERSWEPGLPPGLPAEGPRCASCPGLPTCAGAPADYVELFGPAEILSEGQPPAPRPTPLPPGVVPPPPRQGRAPLTRPRQVLLQSQSPLGADPLAGLRPRSHTAELVWPLVGPTRALRQRLVALAQEGCPRLLVRTLGHPAAVELCREALRAGFAELWLEADPLDLAGASDAELLSLRHVRGLRLPVGLELGPERQEALERLASQAGIRPAEPIARP